MAEQKLSRIGSAPVRQGVRFDAQNDEVMGQSEFEMVQ